MDKKGIFLILAVWIVLLCLSSDIVTEPVRGNSDSPIIVCTTNVLGSIVEQYVGNQTEVVVLAQPGLCPADYDIKPSDIEAVSKAKVLFYHGIMGEYWLDDLIEASGNTNITKIKISGPWNTPEGAKRYIRWIGGNLSQILGIDLNETMNAMIEEIDRVSSDIQNEAASLGVNKTKVICMQWQASFVSWVGFDVIATYGPPQMLSTADIQNLTETAKKEGVALIIDNLQSGTEVGNTIATECNAIHVVLSNFPGALPQTETLAKMIEHNARELFYAVKTWRSTRELRAQNSSLQTQLMVLQSTMVIILVIAVVEAILLYRRK